MISTSCSFWAEAYKQENVKTILANLNAQLYLEKSEEKSQSMSSHSATIKEHHPFPTYFSSVSTKLQMHLFSSNKKGFKTRLMKKYRSQHPTDNFSWCPVLGNWIKDGELEAVNLFDSMHGQDVMNSVFQKPFWRSGLCAASNGLVIHYHIAEAFDSGKFVIVPDNEKRPAIPATIRRGLGTPQECKIQIIDPMWNQLDEEILTDTGITWRKLDGKRLKFRAMLRPKAQYLYFHYCLQLLRRAWQYKGLSTNVLEEDLNKNLWDLPRSLLPRDMLLALVEELGSEYVSLLQCSKGKTDRTQSSPLLLDVYARQVIGWQCKWISSDSDEDYCERSWWILLLNL